MRYRTVIEVVCDAYDREDAIHVAGEYLRGEEDFGVVMTCRTSSLRFRILKHLGLASAIVLVLMAVLVLKDTPLEGKEKASRQLDTITVSSN